MLTSGKCLKKYGKPATDNSWLTLLFIPAALQHGFIPKKVYCNKDFKEPFLKGLANVRDRGLQDEIVSWDGCFNIRNKRGQSTLSLHSWGVAFDINAAHNRFGEKPTMSPELVKCFTDAGFDWGGFWKKPDGMHFQLNNI